MRVLLVPVSGDQSIKFDKPILLVGRHPDCDIVLLQSRKISRKHCILALIDSYITVRDLDSLNGIRINDSAVKRQGHLNLGDTLQIGDVSFRLFADQNSNQHEKNLLEGVSTDKVTTASPIESDAMPSGIIESAVRADLERANVRHAESQEFPVIVDDPDEDSEEFIIPPLNNI